MFRSNFQSAANVLDNQFAGIFGGTAVDGLIFTPMQ